MKALVTGGSGFIGSHVVDQLIKHGVDVRVFDMVKPCWHKAEDVDFYQGSLLDLESVAMSMSGIDAVFHLAAVADVKDVFENPIYSEGINVRGTINVLDAAKKAKSVQRIVVGSTSWLYSAADVPDVDEDTPLHAPDHLYTATKMVSEYYCQTYSTLYGLPFTIMRYGIPYGPRARDGAVIPIFVNKAINGEAITIAGDGSQFRNFVYVEDLALGNVLGLKDVAKNQIYNLNGTERVTIKEIAETVQKVVGEAKIEYVPARPGDFSGKNICSEKAKKELGWKASTNFEDGVRKYVEWFKARATQRKKSAECVCASLQ